MFHLGLGRIAGFVSVALRGGPRHAAFLDASASISLLADSSKSLIRYGDGEFVIMSHHGIHYQDADPGLAEELTRIAMEYDDEKSPYYLAMPARYFTCSWPFFLRYWKKMKHWVYSRNAFMRQFDRKVVYLDAFLFAEEYKGVFENIWLSPAVGRLILVHNDPKYAESLRQSSGKEVAFVQIPPRNAYQGIDGLVESVRNVYTDGSLTLVSAGPCGKALTYRLARMGIRCIDTGHCFDMPLTLVDTKESIGASVKAVGER